MEPAKRPTIPGVLSGLKIWQYRRVGEVERDP
jgi:hypothetical protein